MGYLAHILIAAGTLIAYAQGVGAPLRAWSNRLGDHAWLPIAALTALPYAVVAIERKLVVRGRFRLAAALHVVLIWFGPIAFAAAVLAFDWPGLVERWTGAEVDFAGWPQPSLFLVFTPFVVLTVLGIDALARANEVRATEIERARTFQLRLFAAALAPFVLLFGVTCALGIDARVRASIEYVALWSAVLTLGLGAATILFLPGLLRRAWDTVPMPSGRARDELERFARHVRFECDDFVVWRTGHQMANAAVVGVGARQRIVIFSDLLLSQLPLRELVAVLAHEVGHVARHHVFTFIAWSLALFLGADLALELLEVESEWAVAASLLGVLAAWALGFGWLSRRSELEADLYAMQATGDVMAIVSALELVGGPHARSKDSWRHFSTARRIEFLLRASQDDAYADRVSRRMRRFSRLGVALALATTTVHAWRMIETLPEDRVHVELALGDYDRARELSLDALPADSPTFELAARGASLSAEERSPDAIERLAREALARGEAEASLELLALLTYRGDARASVFADAIGAEDVRAAAAELRARDPEWADALEAALRTGSR